MATPRILIRLIPTRGPHMTLQLQRVQFLRNGYRLSSSQIIPCIRRYTNDASSTPARPGQPQAQRNEGSGAPGQQGRKYIFPEKLLIYHAGTGRILFLAVLKLTTIAVSVLFLGVLAPSFYSDDKPWYQTASLCAAGLIPLTFVAYTTSPLVSFLHIRIPSAARTSRQNLERFVRSLPPTTRLEATTLSLIAKPRVSYFEAKDLLPAQGRFGVVNFARDTMGDNMRRKWYMYRAVGQFSLQGGNRGVKEGWVWEELKRRVERKGMGGMAGTSGV